MKKRAEYPTVFLIGGIVYSLIEIIFRGFTHWSMTLTGGLCLALMYRRYKSKPEEAMLKKCLFGAGIITLFEFAAGCIVNIWLRWDVWDYSGHYMNICGQICPLFTAMWYLVSIPAVYLCQVLRKRLAVA